MQNTTCTNTQWRHSYNGPVERKNKSIFIGLTILQFCYGIINVGFGLGLFIVCSTHYRCQLSNWECRCDNWTNVSANLWGGVVVIVCSALSFCKAKSPTKVPKYTALMMTIIGGGSCCVALGLEVAGAIMTRELSTTNMTLHILGAIFFSLAAVTFIIGLLVKNNALSNLLEKQSHAPSDEDVPQEPQQSQAAT